jgi:hypothetical protein
MVFESDIECPSKAIHVVNLAIKPIFTVGRRVNNEISISDISVSRKQAEFVAAYDRVWVSDLDSKFGTFKKHVGLVRLSKKKSIVIQIEKKCFFLHAQKRFTNTEKCKFCFTRNYPKESYDHLSDFCEKYPMWICRKLIPEFYPENKTESKPLAIKQNQVASSPILS